MFSHNDRFVFGAQYLRGETPEREDWARDLESIRDLGFNIVRAWVVWGTLEPAEGDIDFGYLEDFARLAERNGLDVIWLFHMHGAPEWAIRKFSHTYYVNSKGLPFEPASRSNTPTGGWPGLCPDHQDVQAVSCRFIAEVTSFLDGFKSTAYFEPMNEPHMWIDFEQNEIHCYCKATRAAFRKWLEGRYGSLDALNNAWGRRHSCWEDVRPPHWVNNAYLDWYDWRIFTMENLVAELERRNEVIRSNTSRPVIAHAWGGGSLCPDLPGMAFDDWRNARIFDLWGYSAFPAGVEDSVALAMGTDATLSAAGSRTIWQSELGSGENGGGVNRSPRNPVPLQKSLTWETIAHGAKGVLYWQYRKERHGSELGGCGLVDSSGGFTDMTKGIASICDILQHHAPLFNRVRTADPRVGMLFSPRSYIVPWVTQKHSRLPNDSMLGYYRCLWELGVPTHFLHEEFATERDFAGLKAVILPFALAPDTHFLELLLPFIEAGGTVLADPYFAALDQRMWLNRQLPGAGFAEVFGLEHFDIETISGDPVEISYKGAKGLVRGSWFRESYRLIADDVEVVASYTDGTPALTRRRHANGAAIQTGLNLGLCMSPAAGVGDDIRPDGEETFSPLAYSLVNDILKSAGVRPPASTGVAGVTANLMRDPEGKSDLLFVINHNRHPVKGDIFLEEGNYNSAKCLTASGKPEEAVDDGRRLEFDLETFGSAVFILRSV